MISFHLVHEQLVAAAVVPVVYAAAMGTEAVPSLGAPGSPTTVGGRTLLVLPVVVAVVPALVFTDHVGLAVAGVLLWGAATGIQDSTVKALVADLVPGSRLATAYGAFAAFQAVALLAGGWTGRLARTTRIGVRCGSGRAVVAPGPGGLVLLGGVINRSRIGRDDRYLLVTDAGTG